MENFSVTKNTTVELNEARKSSILTGIAVFLLALNILLCITASLGNAVILVALHKETSLHPPTKLLYRCLANTDLCVGVIIHPVTFFLHLSSLTTVISWKMFYYTDKLQKTSSFVLCWSIGPNILRNKRGQTPSAVTWTKIQTCCNITTNSCSYHLLLVDWYISWIDTSLEY